MHIKLVFTVKGYCRNNVFALSLYQSPAASPPEPVWALGCAEVGKDVGFCSMFELVSFLMLWFHFVVCSMLSGVRSFKE